MPVSIFRCRGMPSGIGPPREDELEPRRARAARSSRSLAGPMTMTACVVESRDRPELERLVHRRHAERGRASAERSVRDVGRAVAVPVRLDDRPQLRAAGGTQKRLRIASNGSEIEREARTLHDTLSLREPAGAGREGRSRRGPCGGTRAARRGHARPRRPRPQARRRDLSRGTQPMTPVSTSPVPAVARAGGPRSQTIAPLPGATTIVSEPLSRTTAPKTLRALASGLEPVRADPLRVRVEQPRELAGVGREHRRCGSFERLESKSASASTTAGRSIVSRSVRTSARRPEPRPSPGPRAIAPARSAAAVIVSTASSSVQPTLTASTTSDSATGTDSDGTASVT